MARYSTCPHCGDTITSNYCPNCEPNQDKWDKTMEEYNNETKRLKHEKRRGNYKEN